MIRRPLSPSFDANDQSRLLEAMGNARHLALLCASAKRQDAVRYHFIRARAHAHFEALRSIPAGIGALLCILGGASLAAQFGGGLYLFAIGTFVLIWVVIWNAFSLMIADYEVPPHSN